MDKLYWIACDDKDAPLFEGRYQGRTRGGALKFLKETLGRKNLNGLVFTITEIPVPLIREIVAAMAKERQKGGQGGVLLVENLPQATDKTRDSIAAEIGVSGTPAGNP